METKDKFYVWLVWLAAIRSGGGTSFSASQSHSSPRFMIVGIRKLCFTADQVLMAPPHLPFCILRKALEFSELLYVHTHDSYGCVDGSPKPLQSINYLFRHKNVVFLSFLSMALKQMSLNHLHGTPIV